MEKTFFVLNKNCSIDKLVKGLINVKGEELAEFLGTINITIPRTIQATSLLETLEAPLKKELESTLKQMENEDNAKRLDDARKVKRMRWLESFSGTQLEIELYERSNKKFDKAYLKTFWGNVLEYFVNEKIPDEHLTNFFENVINQHKELPDVQVFNSALEPYYHDDKDTIDGISVKQFEESLLFSSTVKELKEIGAKYNIIVPTKLKKHQVFELIIKSLQDKGKYNSKDHDSMKDHTLKQLEAFATKHNIVASGYINKEQAIEYILTYYKDNMKPKKAFDPKNAPVIEPKVDELKAEQPTKETQPLKDKPTPNKDEKVETSDDMIKPSEDLSLEEKIYALTKELHYTNRRLENLQQSFLPAKTKRIIYLVLLLFVLFGLWIPLSYFAQDTRFIGGIVNLLDRIPFFTNRGFMEFFYRVFEIVILRR